MDTKEILTKYADLKIEADKIDAELEFLKEEAISRVSQFIADNQGTLPRIEGKGRFSVQLRKTWTFPEYVLKREEELKTLKEEAQATGEAVYTEKPSLVFKQDQYE
jgi:hypothetical protein